MNPLGILLIFTGPALVLGWLLLDSWGTRTQRVTCGILALLFMTTTTWFVTHMADTFTFNIKYGRATKALVDETIRGIEAGKEDVVLNELRALQSEYHPPYEDSAKNVQLVQKAANQIKAKNPQQDGADEPATAPQLESSENLNPKSESKPRPQ